MITAIGDALTSVVTWLGTVITSLTSSTGALKDLLPLLAIAIGISLVMLCVKLIRKVSWGA